jgi:hypothetical protein
MNMAVRSYGVTRQGYLIKRKQLDGCLNAVEEAIERGEDVVSLELERSLRSLVPAVSQGMFLAAALEHIFASQEQLFSCQAHDEALDHDLVACCEDASTITWSFTTGEPHVTRVGRISEADAKDLTARIRDRLGEFPLLLLEAHEQRAWVPLRHRSWEQYVRLEFSLSRSRSYELLDQARVIRALRLAAPTQRIPPISALAANQIKPLLGEVVDELRRHVGGERQVNGAGHIDGVVRDVVARARARVAISKASQSLSRSRRSAQKPSRSNLRLVSDRDTEPAPAIPVASPRLIDVVALLAHQIPAADLVRTLSDAESEQLVQLPQAVRWLEELLIAWSARRAASIENPGESTTQHLESGATGPQTKIRRLSADSKPHPSTDREDETSQYFGNVRNSGHVVVATPHA